MEGSVIGQYRVLKKLGEGGMGAVYLAEHTLIGRKAAIKVLLPQLSAHQEIVQRFFNEARAATAVADAGIVQIFDFGYHTDGSAYIVMEFLEGETLDARLRRLGRLPAHDAARIMRQVATSLAAAHGRGIVHRDLKPENIFLVRDSEVAGGERPKILDFGIAKLTGDESSKVKTHTAAIMGTPYFMSPEQCRGAGGVDHRSDVYALGCVMFHLLTGTPPFDGEGAGDIIASHLREPAPAPSSRVPGIAPEVDQVVLTCMAKSPDQRYQSMQALATVLGQLVSYVTSPHAAAASPSGQIYSAPSTPPMLGTAPAVASSPTTLSSIASQVGPTLPPPKKRGLGLAIGAVVLAAAGAVALVIVTQRGSGGGPAPDEPPAETTPAASQQPTEPVPAPEPAPAPEPEPKVEPPPPPPPEPEKVVETPPRPDEPKKKKKKKKGTGSKSACDVPGDTDCDGIPDGR